ncbi:MAG: nucleotidyltransferase domain-containing protein [Pseudomonadota bacterium]
MRALSDGFDPDIVARIDDTLDQAIADQHLTIPLAIESGSRAWGFPSPDSDYDCRFFFVRRFEEVVTLAPPRDVYEHGPPGLLDIGGWEIGKACRLLLKGNAVVVEWLTSPLIYRGDEMFRSAFLDLARRIGDRNAFARHYLHLGRGQWERTGGTGGPVNLKKLFYALRPALALRWMRLHPDQAIVPMHFPTLCSEVDLSQPLLDEIDALRAQKAVTREMGEGAVPIGIAGIVSDEFERAESWTRTVRKPDPDAAAQANAFYRWALACYSKGWPG